MNGLLMGNGANVGSTPDNHVAWDAAAAASHAQNTDTGLAAVGTKNPPIDAEKVLYRDSTAGDALVTSTWTQVKAFLKTYFDTVYAALVHATRHAVGGADAVFPADPGADKFLKWNDGSDVIEWNDACCGLQRFHKSNMYHSSSITASSYGGITLTNDYIYAVPYIVGKKVTVSRMAV